MVKVEKVIGIVRVSSDEQGRKGTSLETQEEWIRRVAKEKNFEIIRLIRETTSGEEFPRKYFDEFVELAEKEKLSYILVYSLDRFARNLPYGSFLLQKLAERGVKIITSVGEYDLNNPNDRQWVWISLVFAESENYYRCERTARGILNKLKSGGLPYKPPFGCEISDGKVRIKPDYKPVIRFIFSSFIQLRCYNKVAELVNEKFGKGVGFKLDGQTVKKIVTNPIYTGFVPWNGLLFGKEGSPDEPNESLQVIDAETFKKAQAIVRAIKRKNSRKPNPSNGLVMELIEEYGVDMVLSTLNLKVSCPKCDDTGLKENGNEIVGGGLVKKYICGNCGHQFRFPSAKQLKKFRELNSRRCMKCGAADKFTFEQNEGLWKVTCRECGFIVFLPEGDEYVGKANREEIKEKKKIRDSKTQKPILRRQIQKLLNHFQ